MQLALLFAQNSSLSNFKHCALSNIPTVSCGHMSFNSIQVPQHVLTFKLMGFVLLQVKQQEQPSLHIISSYLHVQKLLDMKVKRAEGNSFHFLLRTCRKICCLLTVIIECY